MTPLTKAYGDGAVAVRYGLEEAVFLDSIMFWYRTNRAENRNLHDGRWWTHNSIKAFESIFPWWSAPQLRRIAENCKKKGALLVGNYNKDQRDRTLWYTPSDDLLELYREKCICENTQMHESESTGECAKIDEPLPCTTHEETDMSIPHTPKGDRRGKSVPKYRPEWFAFFWEQCYPKKDGKAAAVKAWDKLRPDAELCRVMRAAIERAKQSRQWTKDNGEYIPHFATWLNQRRWQDGGVDLSQLPLPPESGGSVWAADPEKIV